MAQKKTNVVVGQTNPEGSVSVNKMELVSQLLQKDASLAPQQIVAALKVQGVEISSAMASTYKSQILSGKRGGGQQRATGSNGRSRRQTNVASIASEMEGLRGLVKRYGRKEVERLLNVVAD